jgi:dihydroneopterin aldolase
MTLTITLKPIPSGNAIMLTLETEDRADSYAVGYDAIFDRITEHINNRLRPLVNTVANDAKRAREAASKGR